LCFSFLFNIIIKNANFAIQMIHPLHDNFLLLVLLGFVGMLFRYKITNLFEVDLKVIPTNTVLMKKFFSKSGFGSPCSGRVFFLFINRPDLNHVIFIAVWYHCIQTLSYVVGFLYFSLMAAFCMQSTLRKYVIVDDYRRFENALSGRFICSRY